MKKTQTHTQKCVSQTFININNEIHRKEFHINRFDRAQLTHATTAAVEKQIYVIIIQETMKKKQIKAHRMKKL